MKRYIILFGILILGIGIYAQKPVFLECKVEKNLFNELNLFQVKDGKPLLMAKAGCNANGYFGFQFIPEYEGFYVVGDDFKNQYPVYMKPGDRASIIIDRQGARLKGKKNTRENQLLYQWMDLAHYVCSRSVKFYEYKDCTYKEFFRNFEKFLPEAERFKHTIHSKNSRFDQLLKRSIDFEKDYYALAFVQAFRNNSLRDTNLIAYYKTIYNPEKLQDTVLLQMPYGMRFLERYSMNAPKSGKISGINMHLWIDSIPDNRLKGELILKNTEKLNTYEEYRKVREEFDYILTPAQKVRMELIGASLYSGENGDKAENFSYPDINGKMISLSDFRGKIVVVDVWATWCGPCRAQIPYFKKLEEEMRGKEIVFISISVDEKKDWDKWKKMVGEMELKGVQLFADKGKQIRTAYKIQGIPRFMVFDRNGYIISRDAPRPDKPELKKLLEHELRKR